MMPTLTATNRAFWTGGARGELLIQRCGSCHRWVHPPSDRCPVCDGEVTPTAVSGRGTIFSFTVNFQQFHPDVAPPNTIVIVQLEEQDDLRIPSNLVDYEDDDLRIGAPVRVRFEPQGEHFFPLFAPDRSAR